MVASVPVSPPLRPWLPPYRNGLGDDLTPEQERWAEALAILKQHGDDAPIFIAERI